MPTVTVVKKIQASPQEVWDAISDIEKAPEWVTVMQSLVETTDNPVKEGTVYREKSKIGPKESETTWHVTRFEAPRLQVHECKESDFAAKLTMEVEVARDGARLTHITEYALMPNFRPLGWLMEKLFIQKKMNRDLRASIDNLVGILQAPVAEKDNI